VDRVYTLFTYVLFYVSKQFIINRPIKLKISVQNRSIYTDVKIVFREILTLTRGWIRRPFRFFGTNLTATGVRLKPIVLFARVLDDTTVRGSTVDQRSRSVLDYLRWSAVHKPTHQRFAGPFATESAFQFLRARRLKRNILLL